jgi:PrtD family type I secretion system ABC transporter
MSVALFSVFINLLRLAVPLYILQILDRVIGSRSMETLLMLAIITAAAVMFGTVMEMVRRHMLMAWGNWIERIFGPILFATGMKKGGNMGTALSSLLRDVRTLRFFVSGDGLVAWIDVIWAPLFIFLVFLIYPLLGYILLAGCLLALMLGLINQRLTRDSRELSYMAVKDDQDWIAAAERHHETVSSLDAVRNFARRWCNSALVRLDEGMRAQLINMYFATIIRMVGRFLRIAILGVGVWLVVEQELTIGALIAASVLARTAYSLIQHAVVRWRELMVAGRAYGRIRESLKKDNVSFVSIPKTSQPVPLVLENVSYRYPSQANSVFRNVSLTVNPGEALFVIGPSASGKTTLSRLISGLFSPRSGNVRLGDVHVFQLQQNSMSRGIGTLPQDTTLFRGTVRENIASMSLGDIDEVIRSAKMAGIHDTILALPAGYDTVVVEYEPLLSSGQRKAIALARAFYGHPALVVLDEPIPHLDKSGRSALFKAMDQLKEEKVIVVITTQAKVPSKYADKVVLLDDQRSEVFQNEEEITTLRSNSRSGRKRNKQNSNNSHATA